MACGLCCDGSIFGHVKVDTETRNRMADQVDFEPPKKGQSMEVHRMRLPCRQLGESGDCSCYDTRPDICRTYQCKLLRGVRRDAIPQQQAQQTVSLAKSLRDHARGQCNEAAVDISRVKSEGRLERAMSLLQSAKMAENAVVDDELVARATLHFNHYAKFIREHFYSHYGRVQKKNEAHSK